MKEKVLCAAILYEAYESPIHTCKNVKGLVLCGFRHAHIIGQVYSLLRLPQYEMGQYIQGFITNKNNFLNREEAYNMALENGQIIPERMHEGKWELFSEDLY